MLAAGLEQLAVGLLVHELGIEELPQVHELQEIRGLVAEFLVGPVRLLAQRLGTVARILDRERRGEDHHLGEAVELARREQQAPDARIDGQAREAAAQGREDAPGVDRAQLEELPVAVVDLARRGRIEEGVLGDRSQLERGHAQDHRGERGAQDLGRGVLGALEERRLVVQPDRHAARNSPAASRALARRRLRDRLDAQLVDLLARRVALQAREPRVDHVVDAGDGERGLRDVGREHDPAARAALEDAVLLLGGQARIQRQDLDRAPARLAQRLSGLADLALARQEHEHVAVAALAGDLLDGLRDRLVHVHGLVVLVLRLEELGPVADLYRVGATRHLDHGRAVEESREALRVDGGGGDDHFQLGAHGDEALRVSQQEVHVQAALVGLIDDERVVGAQLPVRMRFREQHPVGHDLHHRVGPRGVLEADLVPDQALRGAGKLVREAMGEAARGDAPRLRAADESRRAAPHGEADLRDLRGLARARLAAHDGHRMVAHELHDAVAVLRDRQLGGKLGARQAGEARGMARARALQQVRQQRALALRAAPLARARVDGGAERGEPRVVGGERGVEEFSGKRGHEAGGNVPAGPILRALRRALRARSGGRPSSRASRGWACPPRRTTHTRNRGRSSRRPTRCPRGRSGTP